MRKSTGSKRRTWADFSFGLKTGSLPGKFSISDCRPFPYDSMEIKRASCSYDYRCRQGLCDKPRDSSSVTGPKVPAKVHHARAMLTRSTANVKNNISHRGPHRFLTITRMPGESARSHADTFLREFASPALRETPTSCSSAKCRDLETTNRSSASLRWPLNLPPRCTQFRVFHHQSIIDFFHRTSSPRFARSFPSVEAFFVKLLPRADGRPPMSMEVLMPIPHPQTWLRRQKFTRFIPRCRPYGAKRVSTLTRTGERLLQKLITLKWPLAFIEMPMNCKT